MTNVISFYTVLLPVFISLFDVVVFPRSPSHVDREKAELYLFTRNTYYIRRTAARWAALCDRARGWKVMFVHPTLSTAEVAGFELEGEYNGLFYPFRRYHTSFNLFCVGSKLCGYCCIVHTYSATAVNVLIAEFPRRRWSTIVVILLYCVPSKTCMYACVLMLECACRLSLYVEKAFVQQYEHRYTNRFLKFPKNKRFLAGYRSGNGGDRILSHCRREDGELDTWTTLKKYLQMLTLCRYRRRSCNKYSACNLVQVVEDGVLLWKFHSYYGSISRFHGTRWKLPLSYIPRGKSCGEPACLDDIWKVPTHWAT